MLRRALLQPVAQIARRSASSSVTIVARRAVPALAARATQVMRSVRLLCALPAAALEAESRARMRDDDRSMLMLTLRSLLCLRCVRVLQSLQLLLLLLRRRQFRNE